MQDLSGSVFPDGPVAALCPTSQHAGNRPAENIAMTAPGTASQSVEQTNGGIPQNGNIVGGPPFSESKNTSKYVRDPEKRTPAPNPYPKTTGPRWVRAGGVASEGMNDYG